MSFKSNRYDNTTKDCLACGKKFHLFYSKPNGKYCSRKCYKVIHSAPRICSVVGCNKKHEGNGFCGMHNERLRHYGSPYICKKAKGLKGIASPAWKGGLSEYPNHYLMKKNRLIILMNNPKCEMCGEPATQVHHIDLSKTNHNLSNLMAVCASCNHKMCKPHTAKYIRLYGASLRELGKMFQRSCSAISRWHRADQLQDKLKEKLEKL